MSAQEEQAGEVDVAPLEVTKDGREPLEQTRGFDTTHGLALAHVKPTLADIRTGWRDSEQTANRRERSSSSDRLAMDMRAHTTRIFVLRRAPPASDPSCDRFAKPPERAP